MGKGAAAWASGLEFPESVVIAAVCGAGAVDDVAAFKVGVGITRPVGEVGWTVAVAEVAGAVVAAAVVAVGACRVLWRIGATVLTRGAAMYKCGVTLWTSIGVWPWARAWAPRCVNCRMVGRAGGSWTALRSVTSV